MFAFSLEPLQRVADSQAVGQLQGRSCRRADGAVVSEQVAQMHDTDHIVQVARVDHRCSGVPRFDQGAAGLLDGRIVRQCDDGRAWDQHVA